MPVRPELTVRLPNSPGALAGVCRLLSAEGVNVLALCLESSGQVRLVVDNHIRAAGVLRDAHHQVSERDVLVTAVPHRPGGVASVLQALGSSGVNLDYAYASAADGSGPALVVLAVADAQRAALAAGL
jgi:hypothetical protein